MIELFNLANDPSCSYPYDGFLQPDYTYYANVSGEIQYICREEEGECGEVLDCIVGGIFGPWFKGRTLTYPHRTKRETFLKSTATMGARTLLLPGSKLEIGLSVSRWRWADQMWLYPLRQLLCRMGTYELDAVARV